MQLFTVSETRGLHGVFNGYGKQAYVIHSEYYGFIAYADIEDECGSHDITINLYITDSAFHNSWDPVRLIKTKVNKLERQFISTKKIKWNVNVVKNDEYEIARPKEYRFQLAM